ncbi:MAG: PhzF family phenazine biosynthesis protein [Hyphomicrobiales bacterium]|nr:PhzF family phenazine biosynthesis protein [Hyphomicrobiales bacterium]MCP5371537.1 PhzF family phenazine biosynthesis protein [Hyphomicrobiales bacterium]
MTLTLYQIDAFTDRVFGGNPAAVCPVDEWPDAAVMQAMAMENNLSETVFYRARPDGDFDIRYFTPKAELDLAGHPTLATAHLVLEMLQPDRPAATFHTHFGETLTVTRRGGALAMDFPARPPVDWTPNRDLADILGVEPELAAANPRGGLVLLRDEAAVRAVRPDLAGLMALDRELLIVTAPGSGTDCDFVSRVFAPQHGVYEDPVTGSAHCALIPFWADRLGKDVLLARQVSARGGVLYCRALGEGEAGARVEIAGRCAPYMVGQVTLP